MGLRGMPSCFIQLKKELGKEKAKIPRKHIKFPFHDGSIKWWIYMGLRRASLGFIQLTKELRKENQKYIKNT